MKINTKPILWITQKEHPDIGQNMVFMLIYLLGVPMKMLLLSLKVDTPRRLVEVCSMITIETELSVVRHRYDQQGTKVEVIDGDKQTLEYIKGIPGVTVTMREESSEVAA